MYTIPMSNDQILHSFSNEAALPRAWAYYLKTCGLPEKPESPKQRRMLERSEAVLSECLPMVNIRALTRRFGAEGLAGGALSLGPATFHCPAFGRLERDSVLSIYAYVLSAGEVALETENVSDQLFADIWGTSFTDAGIDLLEAEIARENPGAVISSSFGPGFFGMDISMLAEFFNILSPKDIGVSIRSNCLLLPLKSSAGFFFAVRDEWMLPTRDCESCHGGHDRPGNAGGCLFCANYQKPPR